MSDRTAASRSRRYRDRLRRRAGVADVEYDEEIIDTLVDARELPEAKADDRREVAAAIRRYLKRKDFATRDGSTPRHMKRLEPSNISRRILWRT